MNSATSATRFFQQVAEAAGVGRQQVRGVTLLDVSRQSGRAAAAAAGDIESAGGIALTGQVDLTDTRAVGALVDDVTGSDL
jgi:hypothetical protein